ncbi:MAG TPA: hypothetical protein VFH46_06870 [Pyrinomonadaceae bacterium]|nr:hypothetical protein [Pyrinomonadaceae bacterium]
MALEATPGNSRDIQQDRNELTNDPLATHEQPHNERVHGINQHSPQIDTTQTQAAELAVESESEEIAAVLI